MSHMARRGPGAGQKGGAAMTPTMAPPPQIQRQLATRSHGRRILLILLLVFGSALGGALWLLNTRGKTAAKATATPTTRPWMRQGVGYPDPEKRPAPMLFYHKEMPDTATPAPAGQEYVLAPGTTKLPCIVETAMNSDVEGYFTATVSTNIYDTATGRHLLVPQNSTILGHDQSAALLYGNERLPTISLTLALPDGRSVDLGQAPVTDQQGIAGLTGRVNQHYWRLFGAVFIGGALRGGMQALHVATAPAGGAGQVASGIAATGNQATQQRLGRALDTRPTITVDSGQLCQVLLTKPLTLPALWQYGGPGVGHAGLRGGR